MSVDIISLGAAELAARIAVGQLTSQQVVEAFISRIETVNPLVNAVCVPLFAQARAEAQAKDEAQRRGEPLGPLHGVPVTIKECFHVTGTPATMGLSKRQAHIALSDAPLVARLRAAGAVVLGKTNVPQLMLLHETDNPLYGRTNNPWNLDRTAGGSSGGEAAIIAGGGSPLGLGTDMGGSIRIPAHFCGIAGLKPSSYRLTKRGALTTLRGLEIVQFQPGPMARRVDDLELAMQVLTSSSAGETQDFQVPPVPWRSSHEVDVAALRIGLWMGDGGSRPSPALRRVLHGAEAALSAAGATVQPFSPPDVREAMRLYFAAVSADGSAGLRQLLRGSRKDPRVARLVYLGGIPRWTRPLLARAMRRWGRRDLANIVGAAGSRTAASYWRLTDEVNRYIAGFLQSLRQQQLDVLVMPPHTLPAFPHGLGGEDLMPAAAVSFLVNLLGIPGGVVPAGRVAESEQSQFEGGSHGSLIRSVEQGSAGLPIGIQVAAPHWREDHVLAVMRVLESHFQSNDDYPSIADLPVGS